MLKGDHQGIRLVQRFILPKEVETPGVGKASHLSPAPRNLHNQAEAIMDCSVSYFVFLMIMIIKFI